jgi:hypothetical protein
MEEAMTTMIRKTILRADAAFLLIAGSGGFVADLLGAFYGIGPQGAVLAQAPHAAIGAVEAHGLAIVLGVLLWRAAPARAWHLTAVAIHVLLGTSNLVFWSGFAAAGMLAVGYITTALHGVFATAQLAAAFAAGARALRPA